MAATSVDPLRIKTRSAAELNAFQMYNSRLERAVWDFE